MDNADKEMSIYSSEFLTEMLENDCIAPEEEGFMRGYQEDAARQESVV